MVTLQWPKFREVYNNDDYLKLFDGIELDKKVDNEMIYQLISKFALVVDESYDWAKDEVDFKTIIPRELSSYDLDEMYFCLNFD